MPRFSFLAHITAPDATTVQTIHDAVATALATLAENLPEDQGIATSSLSASERDQQIRDMANEEHGREGELEFDEGCLVSESDDNGAYVQAWRWVSFAGTVLDKDNQDG